jgi:hypothetical protein
MHTGARMIKSNEKPMHFNTVPTEEVPQGRRGKHTKVVGEILNDLNRLPEGAALKVPLDGLGEAKIANLRSALNRATKQRRLQIATSTDQSFLYIWSRKPRGAQRSR